MKLSRKKRKYFANSKNILGHYKIATPDETIQELIDTKKSICRFGDGEFDMIYGIGMNYQKYNEKLAKRLEEIVNPELAINRAKETYIRKGYEDTWIAQRLKTIDIRRRTDF